MATQATGWQSRSQKIYFSQSPQRTQRKNLFFNNQKWAILYDIYEDKIFWIPVFTGMTCSFISRYSSFLRKQESNIFGVMN